MKSRIAILLLLGLPALGAAAQEPRPAGAAGNIVEEPQTNFSVVRLKKGIYPQSTLGLVALNEAPPYGKAGHERRTA